MHMPDDSSDYSVLQRLRPPLEFPWKHPIQKYPDSRLTKPGYPAYRPEPVYRSHPCFWPWPWHFPLRITPASAGRNTEGQAQEHNNNYTGNQYPDINNPNPVLSCTIHKHVYSVCYIQPLRHTSVKSGSWSSFPHPFY